MSQIPTIPGSAQVPDVQLGTKRDPRARIQALAGVRRVASAAEGAVDTGMSVIADYEEKKRKAEEAYVFNSSSLSFQKMHTDFLHNVKKTPDEQIVPNWTGATQAWRQSQLDQYGSKLSPRAKKYFEMNMDSAIGGSTAKFQVVADKLGSQRRESAAVANAQEFLKSGDEAVLPRAKAALDLAVKAGDMTPEKRDSYADRFPGVLQENQIRNGIVNNPVATLHGIDEGKYDKVAENPLVALRKQTVAAVNTNQVAAYQDIRKQQEEGKVFTKKELSDMADAEKIRGSSIKEALDAQGGEVSPEDIKANVSIVHDAILSIPKDADPDERTSRTAEIMASKPYQNLPNAVKKQFDGDLKAGKSELPEMHRTQAEMMKRTFDDVMGVAPTGNKDKRASPFVEGGLKKIETMPDAAFKETFGHKASRSAVMKAEAAREESARDWYADAQTQYRSWAMSAQGQKAKPQEAEAERVRLGFGTYSSVTDLIRDFQAGKIDSATTKKIGMIRFGIE